MTAPLLEIDDLTRRFTGGGWRRRSDVLALDRVSLTVQAGESLGIVGESGSGKSTLARLVMALDRPTAGAVRLNGQDLFAASPAALRRARRDLQMVFQDPYGSLDPRHRVATILAEPLRGLGLAPGRSERIARVARVLKAVGLRASDADRYPHAFSGGQRQRLAIARALIVEPVLIVADEPVSALDMSVQAQVLNLLAGLQAGDANDPDGRRTTFLFISHDLGVVARVTRRVAVLYRGRVVETGPTVAVLNDPAHPYTRALVSAIPRLSAFRDGNRLRDRSTLGRARSSPALANRVPDFAAAGCAYGARCPLADARCRRMAPDLRPYSSKNIEKLDTVNVSYHTELVLPQSKPSNGRAVACHKVH